MIRCWYSTRAVPVGGFSATKSRAGVQWAVLFRWLGRAPKVKKAGP